MTTDNLPATEALRPARNTRSMRNRILVVDDDASVREMLVRVLVGEGYLVWSAADGSDALELASSKKIDLVLLDLKMPDKNGWYLFQRFMEINPLLTVVIITAKSNQLFTALGAGVAALMEKPFNFPAMLQTIGQLLAEPPEVRKARLSSNRTEFSHLHAGPEKQKK